MQYMNVKKMKMGENLNGFLGELKRKLVPQAEGAVT